MYFLSLFALTFQLSMAADTFQLSYRLSSDTQDFEHFQSLLKDQRFFKIEEFLELWKQDRPEYFSNYVMAYRSRSLQQATPSHPRIIMFSKNADFVLSFNGHETHRGYENIEMMRFNHIKNSFEFFELDFVEGSPRLSETNPKKCLECHQSSSRTNVDPRPNWEPYNAWLGFYGSIDDSTESFKNNFVKKSFFDPIADHFLIDEFNNEPTWFEHFWNKVKPQNSRYSFLDDVVNENYSSETTINGDLTNRLAVLNMRRIARLVKEDQELYEQIKWTLWSYGKCGQSFPVTKDVLNWLAQETPRKPIADLKTKFVAPSCDGPMVFEGFECHSTALIEVEPYLRLTDVLHLIVEPFNLDTEDWSMDFKTGGRYAAFERFGLTNDPRPPLNAALEQVFKEDPDFQDITCSEAKTKSLELFSDISKVEAFYNQRQLNRSEAPRVPLIQRCITCHVEQRDGYIPYIPFHDLSLLKTSLLRTGYKRGSLIEEIMYRTGSHAGSDEQMPPRELPSEEQRQELIDFLRQL